MYSKPLVGSLLALCFLLFVLGGCARDSGPEVRVRGSYEVGGGVEHKR